MISLATQGRKAPAAELPARRALAGWRQAVVLGWLALSSVGCLPKIGDDCQNDADCSQVGDRVCDTTQVGGYCTQFNCTPDSCPQDEGICVTFGASPSLVAGCTDEGRPSPFARSFCMKPCSKDKDCRDGYLCIDLAEDDPWAAEVIQTPPSPTKVCLVPESASNVDVDLLSDLQENVCKVPSAGGLGGGAGSSGGGVGGEGG
jgi:hypothetical protein